MEMKVWLVSVCSTSLRCRVLKVCFRVIDMARSSRQFRAKASMGLACNRQVEGIWDER